jgi:hypothetical protein
VVDHVVVLVCVAALAGWMVVQWRIDRAGRRDHLRLAVKAEIERDDASHKRLMEQMRLEHDHHMEQAVLEAPPEVLRVRTLELEIRRDEAAAKRAQGELALQEWIYRHARH